MFSKKLSNLIRARFPFIYITTYEEDRITELIKNMVLGSKSNIKREIFTWTQTSGLWNQTTDKNIQGSINPLSALEFIENYDKNALFIMYDFHVNFGIKNRPADYDVIRKLRDLSSILKTSKLRKNIIFVAPEVVIPDTLQKELTILDFPLPNLEEIKSKLNKKLVKKIYKMYLLYNKMSYTV